MKNPDLRSAYLWKSLQTGASLSYGVQSALQRKDRLEYKSTSTTLLTVSDDSDSMLVNYYGSLSPNVKDGLAQAASGLTMLVAASIIRRFVFKI